MVLGRAQVGGLVAVAVLAVAVGSHALGVRAGQRSLAQAGPPTVEPIRDPALQARLQALVQRQGEFEARLQRLEVLGRRVVQWAQLPPGEFEFEQAPRSMPLRLEQAELTLPALESALLSRRLGAVRHPDRNPLDRGALSSDFGLRADPFSGAAAQHEGVDLTGPPGTPVRAAAAGVVRYAGDRDGYGRVVEIDHGNGYVSRYAHAQRSLVTAGQAVGRGQPVALLGGSGRSTGPHLHFEVLRNGRPVDPLALAGR